MGTHKFKVGDIVEYSGNTFYLYEIMELDEHGNALALKTHCKKATGFLDRAPEIFRRPDGPAYQQTDMSLIQRPYIPIVEDTRDYLQAVTE